MRRVGKGALCAVPTIHPESLSLMVGTLRFAYPAFFARKGFSN
jgi:hypothetical protein